MVKFALPEGECFLLSISQLLCSHLSAIQIEHQEIDQYKNDSLYTFDR